MNNNKPTLEDWGEWRLIDDIIAPLAKSCDPLTETGSDCAYIPVPECHIAVTADVGPKPLLHRLKGYEDDLVARGWLAVVASASDIATSGAQPLCLLNCTDAPPNLPVADLQRLLAGYFKACSDFGFRNAGGDIRQGTELSMRVTAIGTCLHPYRIGRDKATVGHILYLVGPAGQFMANYLIAESILEGNTNLPLEIEDILRFPRPQLKAMKSLADRGLVVAASDTSDGLLGALDNIVRKSRRNFHLTLCNEMLMPDVQQAANLRGIDPWNIFFAWGDWSVAVAIRSADESAFEQVCRENSIIYTQLGVVTERNEEQEKKTATVDSGHLRDLTILRNENFTKEGFNAKLSDHLNHLLTTPLFR